MTAPGFRGRLCNFLQLHDGLGHERCLIQVKHQRYPRLVPLQIGKGAFQRPAADMEAEEDWRPLPKRICHNPEAFWASIAKSLG